MASENVISALNDLYSDLERLRPVIEHVSAAQEVTASFQNVPGQITQLLDGINADSKRLSNQIGSDVQAFLRLIDEQDQAFKDKLELTYQANLSAQQAIAHTFVEGMEQNLKNAKTAVSEWATINRSNHEEWLKAAKANDLALKEELKAFFIADLNAISKEVNSVIVLAEKLVNALKAEIQSMTQLRASIELFYERIKEINFPARFEKLDATIAGTLAGVQGILSRLDLVERNVSGRIDNLTEKQKVLSEKQHKFEELQLIFSKRQDEFDKAQKFIADTLSQLAMQQEKAFNQQKKLMYIIGAAVGTGIIVSIVLKFA